MVLVIHYNMIKKSEETTMKKTTTLQVILTVVFVSAMLISNIITTNQLQFPFGITMTGAIVIFPITYILSDVSIGFSDRYHEIDILKDFDGYCFSAAEGICKPDPAAIKNLMRKYGLKAEECFFIDDKPINIQGAAKAGVDGFVFDSDAEILKKMITEMK